MLSAPVKHADSLTPGQPTLNPTVSAGFQLKSFIDYPVIYPHIGTIARMMFRKYTKRSILGFTFMRMQMGGGNYTR